MHPLTGGTEGLDLIAAHTGQNLQLGGSERPLVSTEQVVGRLDHTPYSLSVSFCGVGIAAATSQGPLGGTLGLSRGPRCPGDGRYTDCCCCSDVVIVGETLGLCPGRPG